MKCAILTFTNELNYGAILQAFALQKYLSNYSNVEVINADFVLGQESLIHKIVEIPKQLKFKQFKNKFMKFSKKIKNYSEFENLIQEEKYDYIIVGSDQVWAFDIIKDKKNIFFINFNNISSKKISYAASFGKNENYLNNKEEVFNYLKSFEKISIREDSTAKLLKADKISCTTCIDPTLLLSKSDYINLLKLKPQKRKYIAVYMLVIDDKVVEIANKISKILDCNIYCFNNKNRFGKNGKCVPYSSPQEFVELIYNAEFVITNSFHGTCFSIIFRKKFISVVHPTRGIRQLDLLNKFGLKDRIYDDKNDINYYLKNKTFDETKINRIINESKKFLELNGERSHE